MNEQSIKGLVTLIQKAWDRDHIKIKQATNLMRKYEIVDCFLDNDGRIQLEVRRVTPSVYDDDNLELSDEDCRSILEDIDELGIQVNDWERKFITNNLSSKYKFTDRQRGACARLMEKYLTKQAKKAQKLVNLYCDPHPLDMSDLDEIPF